MEHVSHVFRKDYLCLLRFRKCGKIPCSVFASKDAIGTIASTVRCADFSNMSADFFR